MTSRFYCELNDIPRTSVGKRAHVYPGPAPLGTIFHAETAGKPMQTKSVQQVDWNTQRVVDGNTIANGGTIERGNTMLITGMLNLPRLVTQLMSLSIVSANDEVRDDLRNVV